MKILLIQPPMELHPNEDLSIVPPLGILYIASVLERNGYQVNILDAVIENPKKRLLENGKAFIGLTWNRLKDEIHKYNPDIVGITCSYSSQSHNLHKTARVIKDIDKNIHVMTGGAHPSVSAYEVLKDENIDVVVIGEGEITVLQYLRCLEEGRTFENLDGFAYKKDSTIIVNAKTRFIENIDSLPFPARHLLPMERYFKLKSPRGIDLIKSPCLSMITSRGCPGRCVFCSTKKIWGDKWRPRSPMNVVDEVEYLVDKYSVREIHFEDDTITLNKKRMIAICNEVINRGLDIKWTPSNGVAIWALDKELLEIMKKAGCYKLTFGLESGNKNTLKFIGKAINFNHAKEIINYANALGIWTHGNFVFGFPYEDIVSINDSLNFAVESNLDFASFFIATPFPGTRLYDIMKDERMITNLMPVEEYGMMQATANTKYFTKDELNEFQKKLYSKFFRKQVINLMKPQNFWMRARRIRSIDDFKFLVKVLKRLFRIII